MFIERKQLSYASAARLIDAAVAKAREIGVPVCISVVDPDGGPQAFARMDGAPHIAVDACRQKAYSALLGMPSGALAEAVKENLPVAVSFACTPGATLLGGGLPILADGVLVGAIGVGGATTDQDVAIAEAALAAVGL